MNNNVLQIHRQFRKPLLVVAPKNLLRHPDAKSGLWEFDDKADDKGILGVRFKRLIMDASAEDRSAHTLVIIMSIGFYCGSCLMVQSFAKRLVLSLSYPGRLGSKNEMADGVLHVCLLLCNAQP